MSFKRDRKQETLIYLGLWVMLLIAPVISLSIRSANTDIAFDWSEILTVWKEYIPFFIVFLVHNHLMAPMLVYRQRRWAYLGLTLAIVVIFQVYQCNHRPNFRRHGPRPEMMVKDQRPPLPPDMREGDFNGPPPLPQGEQPPRRMMDKEPPRRMMDNERPPVMIGQHNIVALIILILMVGMNLGIKLYFKQRSDQKRLAELEKENLEQQLEYLKYQINPHFFMNTLNNIHALVDIDPEKAKETILELSKMMRFVLYEGNKAGVPLNREIDFLQNYIILMKLRYTDKVKIKVETPATLPNKEVPPLMFITFVENAFKHGVSYQQESFIDISIKETGRQGDRETSCLIFTCANSRIPKEEDNHGGVGLANVKKRLDLIYGNNYTLDIKDEPDVYTVTLTIPL